MALIKVGEIVRVHGIRGELVVSIQAGRLRDWEAARAVHFDPEGPAVPIESARFHRGRWLVMLAGVADRDAAEALRGRAVHVTALARKRGGWWPDDWLGYSAEADTGEALGRITEVIHTGANDVIVVTGQGPELLLPVIADVILHVDADQRVVRVHVLDGLRG